ncbi:endoglucanase 13-like [Nymphaea colorata]|nr:endoglucanase 13-like [Nymphaea colorata]
MASSSKLLAFLPLLLLSSSFVSRVALAAPDYSEALKKAILFFEAQRSGKLPANQRVQWRGDSAVRDGSTAGVDLSGGYYDSGDNVKFGLPMAFTVTMLAWGAIEFGSQLQAAEQLRLTEEAIRWGTDYLLKTHPEPNVVYAEVGAGASDHVCWQRPEDMTTPRTVAVVNQDHPGSDLAGETAAALAASSIVFRSSDAQYAHLLVTHAKQLFVFANNFKGRYSDSIPDARTFYPSTSYDDELLWAAAWLYHATKEQQYLDYLHNANNIGGGQSYFSWDDKFVGAQTLVAKLVLQGKLAKEGRWQEYQQGAEGYICSCIQKGSFNIRRTPGGLLWWQDGNNLQYTSAATFILVAYAGYLASAGGAPPLQCPGGAAKPTELVHFARSQVDYILGQNPKSMSYMVGFGSSYPAQVHHRAASIVSINHDPSPVGCSDGFSEWFNKDAPNPNVLVGAVVGGPDVNDAYNGVRSNSAQTEPSTYTAGALVGVLARLTAP